MAKKEMVINSNHSLDVKVHALIYCISSDMEAATAKALREYGLSRTQLDILDALDNSEKEMLTVNEIKSIMLNDSPNVSRSLNKLMENNLILKHRNTIDQRVVKIKITDEGKRVHREADMAVLKNKKDLGLTQDELETLYRILVKL